MNWTLIFNPFSKISSKTLMLVGVVTFLLGCFISWHFKMIYDGILDVHTYPKITYLRAFASNAVNVIVLCASLFILSKIINPSAKMIDILNTSFLYRLPIYLIAALSNIPILKEVQEKVIENISSLPNLQLSTTELVTTVLFSFISLLLLAYSIVIIVSGFKQAALPKKWQHFLSLGVAIVVAEIVSKIFISQM